MTFTVEEGNYKIGENHELEKNLKAKEKVQMREETGHNQE